MKGIGYLVGAVLKLAAQLSVVALVAYVAARAASCGWH